MMGAVILIGCGVAVAALAIGADAFSGWVVHRIRIRSQMAALRDRGPE